MHATCPTSHISWFNQHRICQYTAQVAKIVLLLAPSRGARTLLSTSSASSTPISFPEGNTPSSTTVQKNLTVSTPTPHLPHSPAVTLAHSTPSSNIPVYLKYATSRFWIKRHSSSPLRLLPPLLRWIIHLKVHTHNWGREGFIDAPNTIASF